MESEDIQTKSRFTLTSPSGYKFDSVYIVHHVAKEGQQKLKVEGTLYVGNPKTGDLNEACVTISVTYPESVEEYERKYKIKSPSDPTIANLILAKHYFKCADNKDLLQGEGTVEMLNTAMSFIKQICPFVKEFDLKDSSSKMCDNKTPITLPYFYITNKGKTWYEARFSAHLKPKELHEEYTVAVRDYSTNPLEDFDIFRIRYLKRTPVEVVEALRQLYIKSNSMGDFTDKLYRKHGTKMVCMMLQGWIDDYMRTLRMDKYIMNQHWYIPVDVIPTYPFKNVKSLQTKYNKKNGTRKKVVWNNDKVQI
jgi:hypothetical protein